MSIQFGKNLPKELNDEWFDRLEIDLGVKSIADQCENWESGRNSYVYVYRDITDLDRPIIYVGIGKLRRAWKHWTKSHNDDLNEWIKYWKAEGIVNILDVMSKVSEGLTQRQAAALECKLIRANKETVTNVVDYWCPDFKWPASDNELLNRSKKLAGREQTKQHTENSSLARMNDLKVGLFFNEELIAEFESKGQNFIARWISTYRNTEVAPGNLWGSLRRKTKTRGYWLKLIDGRLPEADPIKKLKQRVAAMKPVLLKDERGSTRLFISCQSAGEKFNISPSSFQSVCLGKQKTVARCSARYLQPAEIKANARLWPIYHKITSAGEEERIYLNLSKAAKELGVSDASLSRAGKTNVPVKVVSMGKVLTIETVHRSSEEEIFGFSIIDDLALPDLYPGYKLLEGGKKWSVIISKDKNKINIGVVYSEAIAKKVVEFFRANIQEKDVIEKAKELLNKLAPPRLSDGYQWNEKEGYWQIQLGLNGDRPYIGMTRSEKIAIKVVNFCRQNEDEPDVVSRAKELLIELKPAPKEAVGYYWHKDNQYWQIKIYIAGKEEYLGTTKSEKFASEVVTFCKKHENEPTVKEQARALLCQLKNNQ